MQFLAPQAYFGFLALAAIPTVLYILFRRRKRDVPWGATYILRRTLKKQSKANVWKQYFIILIRTLAFIALPLAFLHPHLEWRRPEGGAFPPAPPSTHRMVLLDLSGSMTASYGSTTCLDAGLSLCRKMLQAGRAPGRTEIVPLTDTAASLVFDEWPPPETLVEERLGKLKPSDASPDFEKGLRHAVETFRASHHEHKELFILSDFSARDLKDSPSYAPRARSLSKLGVRIFCLTYENPGARNFALLDMTPELDLLLEGQPTFFYVPIGYYGTSPSADTWLTLRNQQGEVFWEEALSLAPGEKVLQIPVTLRGGEQTLTASLREDDLSLDNTLERSYRVRDALRLGLVQNLNLSEGFENPREWLKLALAGNSGGAQHRSITELKHIQERSARGGQGASENLPQAATEAAHYRTILESVLTSQAGPDFFQGKDGLIFLDVDSVPTELSEALGSAIVRGGTLLLAPGPKANPEKFNESFRKLLPALLADPTVPQIHPDAYHHAVLRTPGDRLLREMMATEHGHLGNARFYNHYRIADGSLAEDAQVLLALSDGSPLLLRRTLGRGICLLWTAGLGGEWHSMVVHPAYPVFLSRLFNRAASQQQFPLNLKPGEPILREVDSAQVRVRLPNGQSETVRSVLAGPKRFVRFENTLRPGAYALSPASSDTPDEATAFRYHVAEERQESDYRSLTGEARAAFEERIASPLYPSEESLVTALGVHYRGPGMASSFSLAMLLLLLLEAGLARRWFA
ncbi:MAG: BatA domain-containing protein [Planctomycetes bacterium]|nr:BatA domain-containing protein [Planctomycetota bacterium]